MAMCQGNRRCPLISKQGGSFLHNKKYYVNMFIVRCNSKGKGLKGFRRLP